jgi:hypothetical protein
MMWKTGLSSGSPNHGAFDHDPAGHIFPERDQQLSRQRHDRCLAPTTAVTFDSVLTARGQLTAFTAPSWNDGMDGCAGRPAGGMR